jgi:hypothetical protein
VTHVEPASTQEAKAMVALAKLEITGLLCDLCRQRKSELRAGEIVEQNLDVQCISEHETAVLQ